MPALIGYARVSTSQQTDRLQLDALAEAGCDAVFTEQASTRARRPALERALTQLERGDVLVVWRLDRLTRSLRELIDTVELLEDRGVGLRSLREEIDTTTAGGRLVLHIFGALADFERDLIHERTLAGLAAARARGRVGGRRSVLVGKGRERALSMYRATHPTGEPRYSVRDIAQAVGVSRSTVYRAVSSQSAATS